MKKNKLVKIFTFSVLSCGLLLFSVMLVHNAEADSPKTTSYNVEENGFSSYIEETNETYSSFENDNSLIRQKVVVYQCVGCKTDVIALVPTEALKVTDWNAYILKSDGIPSWIRGKGAIPYASKVNCSNLSNLYGQTMHAANEYRTYSIALKNGAPLVKVYKSGSKTFKPGSKEHTAAQKDLYTSMNLSFTSTKAVLKKMKVLNCLKTKKK